MTPTRASWSATVVVIALLAFAGGARAAGDETDEMKARMHFAAGEYKQALDAFVRLYAETLHPTYLRNIARCHQNLGDADKAIIGFREYLRKAKDITPEQRAEVEGYIAELERTKQAKTEAAPAPPPPAPSPPAAETTPLVGPPTIAATRETGDDGAPFYTRWWFWAAAAGVAAVGIGTALLLSRDGGPTHGGIGALDLRDKGP